MPLSSDFAVYTCVCCICCSIFDFFVFLVMFFLMVLSPFFVNIVTGIFLMPLSSDVVLFFCPMLFFSVPLSSDFCGFYFCSR